MVRVLQSLADEVRAVLFHGFGGRSRELAMVATKLDEARFWAVEHGVATSTHRIVDKRELIGGHPDANG